MSEKPRTNMVDRLYNAADDLGDEVEEFTEDQWKKERNRWFCYGLLTAIAIDILIRALF